MANAKVIIPSGFTHQGKRYLKGDEIKGVNKLQLERWARIGYAEEATAKATKPAATRTVRATTKPAAKKAATKASKPAAKKSATNTVTAANPVEVKS